MLGKTKWLVKEVQLRAGYMINKECIFCKIVKREVKSEFLMESDYVVAFSDINPVARIHILIVPKKHIESVLTVGKDDSEEIVEMFKVAQILVEQRNLGAFRLAFNGGKYQHVPHLHMHLLSGGSIKWSKL